METLSFGIDCAPKDKTPQVTRSPIDQSPAAHLTYHDREHLSAIVNSAPRGARNCSRSNGNLFTLPWNPCSRSRGNTVHHRVEYASGRESLVIQGFRDGRRQMKTGSGSRRKCNSAANAESKNTVLIRQDCYLANTSRPFAGIVNDAENAKSCNGRSLATTAPPLPATCGLTQLS